MIDVGSFQTRSCGGVTRRSFLRLGAALPFFGAIAPLGSARASEARARSVIMVWLWGGPSHLDTFDPKPEAPSGIRGPFTTVPTRTPGEHFSELLPRLARRSDLFSVIRSCRFSGNHDMLPLTGGRRGGAPEPNFGSVVARHAQTTAMPPFVSLVPRTTLSHGFRSDRAPGFGGGRLGSAYDPFIVRCASDSRVEIPSLRFAGGLTPERLAERRLLQGELDRLRRYAQSDAMDALDQQNRSAFSMLTSGNALRAFDLASEDGKTRAAYGRTSFGQSLLLGRRLVEAGVPYVQVNWSLGVDGLEEGPVMGWDTHRNGFGQLMSHHCPVFDRAFTALLEDLDQRGLLSSTLVVAMGEMGRTPKINATGGRDHWPTCSTLWAGGGVRAGRILGKTDAHGGQPVTSPVTPLMIGTTIAELLGINSQQRAELRVFDRGEVIPDIL